MNGRIMVVEIGTFLVIFIISLLLVILLLKRHPVGALATGGVIARTTPEIIKVNKRKSINGVQTPTRKNSPDRFIQTMTATFAHLQVGIAVFDYKNQLSLFNPALSQHLNLRPEWLLNRPNLLGFLDRLRDTQILPEPKDYTSWRKTFMKIERSAMKDDYREDWTLPDGRVLRVIGRPHPSGTVVFLFEDVTATLAMERTFRSRITRLTNAMDSTTIGIIVFDRGGKTTFQNRPLKSTLGAFGTYKTILDFSRAMQQVFVPTPIWGDLRQYIEDTGERAGWQAEVKTRTGDSVLICFEPIITGETLCEFHFHYN